jgi:hypothetical protein
MAQKTTTKLDEVAARYPDVPRLIILKTDVQRRGVIGDVMDSLFRLVEQRTVNRWGMKF